VRISTARKQINGTIKTVVYKQFWDTSRKETRVKFVYLHKDRIKTEESSSCKFFRKFIRPTLEDVRSDVRKMIEINPEPIRQVAHPNYYGPEFIRHYIATPIRGYKFVGEKNEGFRGPEDEFECCGEQLLVSYLRHSFEGIK
jgi:hypothetical protein